MSVGGMYTLDTAVSHDEAMDFDADHPLSSKLSALQEHLLCPICNAFFNNPLILKCGHSFCSLCIRKHCDATINRTTHDQCPACREKIDLFDARCEKSLASIVSAFKNMREDLHAVVNAGDSVNNSSLSNSTNSQKQTLKTSKNPITTRLSHYNLHGANREKVKKILEDLTKESRVKLRLDGDKETLEKRLRELIHLVNSQVDSISPLGMEDIVKMLNDSINGKEREDLKGKRSYKDIEQLKENGKISQNLENRFQELTQVYNQTSTG